MRPRIPRSLRSRLLLLFAALAVGPLATVGILDYLRSERLVERLVITQTDTVAHRAAKVVSDRYALVTSDVLLFSENAEVQRWLGDLTRGDSAAIRVARAAVDEYLRSVWRLAENTYSSAELRDTAGAILWRAAGDAARDPADQELVITEPMREIRTGRVVGSVVLTPRRDVLWSREALGPSFGRTGYGAIIDRRANRVLAHPSASVVFKSPRELFGKDWPSDSTRLAERSGWLTYRERDSLRTASFVSLTSPPWTILSSSTVGEFADGFLRARRSDIALLVLLIGAVALAFVFFITRATRSLEELTRAAAAVGRGDLSPPLPPAGPDEVGTLSGAFSDMTSRIGSMMREVEVSRQLAVLGEFAAQLSHEVRNPLTSLKLDLQGLQRQVRSGALPISAAESVESSLREVNRLDSVVSGVLELAHRPTPTRMSFCLNEVVDHTLTTLSTQLSSARHSWWNDMIATPLPRLEGDPELLSGMVMNLLINASDVQPKGGRVGVFIEPRDEETGTAWVDLTVADDGPGIPPASATRCSGHSTRRGTTAPGSVSRWLCATARDHGGHIVCEGAARRLHRRGVRRLVAGAAGMSHHVLVVDDERSIRDSLVRQLAPLGYEGAAAESAEQAMGALHELDPAVVITDVRMRGRERSRAAVVDSRARAGRRRHRHDRAPGHEYRAGGDESRRIRLSRQSRWIWTRSSSYWPAVSAIARCGRRVRHLASEAAEPYELRRLVGRDPRMIEVSKLIASVASTRTPVLVRGETGTGKEVVARGDSLQLRRRPKSRSSPSIAPRYRSRCSSRSSLATCVARSRGRGTTARGGSRSRATGTVFLDEIGDVSHGLSVEAASRSAGRRVLSSRRRAAAAHRRRA